MVEKKNKHSKLKGITKEHNYFIDKICEGYKPTKAYEIMFKYFNPDDDITKDSLYTMGSRLFKKYKTEIENRSKSNYYERREKELDIKSNVIQKEEEIAEKKGLGDVAFKEEASESIFAIASHPVASSQAIIMGILQILFDDIEIKQDGKKIIIIKAIPNHYNWKKYENLVKIFIENNTLSKEMFKYAAGEKKPQSPVIANQVNLNINK